MQIKSGKAVSYKKPSPTFHNRIVNNNGNEWDPADFRSTFKSGYIDAMRWMTNNAALLTDIIDDIASGDFRIRYLVRKTRLYSITTHMLNIPAGELYPAWRESVFRRFASAGHFTESVSQKLLRAELHDMDRRDIPYFWVTANDNWVLHETGAVQTTESRTSPKQQAI
ncbi:DUF4135 domain-containing protein [Thalassospiraceae bacterium LMO-JJ14]|nr:DUF4135 domain-containing protein [Thalassospiraceae bacterium LMO-JJ14]